MVEDPRSPKIPLIFYRTAVGSEPVRDWLKGLDEAERQAIGNGLWEIRTDLPTKRTSRVLLCFHSEHLVALHGFIKKTRTTPDEDLATARKRRKELER